MQALAEAGKPKLSPSLARVVHSLNPKKNPFARRPSSGRQFNSVRVRGGSRIARRETKYVDGSFLERVKTSVSPKEIGDLVGACEVSGASPKTFRKVLDAATKRLIELKRAV